MTGTVLSSAESTAAQVSANLDNKYNLLTQRKITHTPELIIEFCPKNLIRKLSTCITQ